MKKLLFAIALLFLFGNMSGKKVKFAVDMTGLTVSTNGVHITGDFQAAAGLGANWDPGTALMTQEGNTAIYSIIVTIPAFKKYEYRILNGDQTYDSEFVPDESRVGYDLVDNRWMFVDSLKNDTTFVGAILFGGNAPSGKKLIRYKVDMRNSGNLPATGIHVGTNYQTVLYSPVTTRLYSFETGIYEIIDYVTLVGNSFIYYKGNTLASAEVVPIGCETNGKRSVTVTKDTVLAMVCFSSCSACLAVGIQENSQLASRVKPYPNPAKDQLMLQSEAGDIALYMIKDVFGREVLTKQAFSAGKAIDVSSLGSGIYFICTLNQSGNWQSSKFAVE